jgi:hypothetical protein
MVYNRFELVNLPPLGSATSKIRPRCQLILRIGVTGMPSQGEEIVCVKIHSWALFRRGARVWTDRSIASIVPFCRRIPMSIVRLKQA